MLRTTLLVAALYLAATEAASSTRGRKRQTQQQDTLPAGQRDLAGQALQFSTGEGDDTKNDSENFSLTNKDSKLFVAGDTRKGSGGKDDSGKGGSGKGGSGKGGSAKGNSGGKGGGGMKGGGKSMGMGKGGNNGKGMSKGSNAPFFAPSPTFGPGPSPTFGPGPSPTFGPGPSPTFGPGPVATAAPFQSPTNAPNVSPPQPVITPMPVINPNDQCPGVPAGGCSVCGDGMCITLPDAVFMFPNQPSVNCLILEDAGYNGDIPISQCNALAPLVLVQCGCNSSRAPVGPIGTTPQPTPAPPTPAPTPPLTPAPTPGPSPGPTPDPTPGPTTGGLPPGTPPPTPPLTPAPTPAPSPGPTPDPTPEPTTGGLPPVTPAPTDAQPVTPAPTDAQPVTPAPTDAQPVTPAPTDAQPVTPAPTDAQPVTPAPTPTPATGCPAVPDGGCSVCGDNQCITIPDAIFTFPNQPDVSCAILQDAGLAGAIVLAQCVFLPDLISGLCGCAALDTGLLNQRLNNPRAFHPHMFPHEASGHRPGEHN